ncbi:MAG: AMP-dependent synthetase/ligase [Treponemataceae bacterium]
MKQIRKDLPWTFLEEWKGKVFTGEWPTLPELFTITKERFPDRSCFTDFDPEKETLSYKEVYQRIQTLSQWMLSKGIQKGDRIAVTGKNSGEWATVYLATLFAGAIIVPIDYGLHEKEISVLLDASKPKLFFVDEEKYPDFKQKSNGYELFSLCKRIPETYVYNLKTSEAFTPNPATEDDTAAILFTSGTTGTPKGVMLSHKNLVSDCLITQTNMLLFETDVFYALLPIHHSYTMLAVFIMALSVGSEIVFGKTMAVTRMLKELKEGKITMLLGVPLLFNKLLAGIMRGVKEKGAVVHGLIKFLLWKSYMIKKILGINPGKKLFKTILTKASIDSIRVMISGGGPLAASVFKTYNSLGIDFVQGYGLTETSPIIALNPIEHFKIESVGSYFHPYMEMKILDPDEKGIGEVAVKGPMVMQGYYNMPAETKEIFTEDGWLKTGDLGKLDSERYLYLCGRAKNMIVTEGGKNVYPEEIENAFQLHFADIEQITVEGYLMDAATKAEGIAALVYPADELLKRLNVMRGDPHAHDIVQNAIQKIVDEVNKNQQPYARISKLIILDEPLEMTTTKKVKRNYAK